MLTTILVALAAVAFAFGVRALYNKYGKTELTHALAELQSVITKLETVIESKTAAIADHLDEIALHQKHVALKGADKDRAQRIVARLNELLQ